ncbi:MULTISPECIES: low specificity L-threonine aldolase [unclassified Microcoleus]|uniref:low specificity L-threonine aldolase n=1 Tax=unclassified Microcoleus TaxID=2642155 RepID=UPI002FD2F8BE
MNFCSDNVTDIAPEIMAALVAASKGAVAPYGQDEYTSRLEVKFSELFETAVTIFPVVTDVAANALALSVMSLPFGAIYCHSESNINLKACGATEFYTGGAKLLTLQGEDGKIQASDLATVLGQAGFGIARKVQPTAVSLTQATEVGTVYSPDEIHKIAEFAQTHSLSLHMDGTRFANAVVSLNCSPADITWRAGVDVLSLGATNNGAIAAEAVVFFNRALAETFSYRCKRGGHLISKMWFLSVQLEAYITDNLWLRNATYANQMATKLAAGLASLPGIRQVHAVEANEVFIQLPETVIQGLIADGFQFYRCGVDDSNTIQLVTAFNTLERDINTLLESARRYAT